MTFCSQREERERLVGGFIVCDAVQLRGFRVCGLGDRRPLILKWTVEIGLYLNAFAYTRRDGGVTDGEGT